MSSLHTKPKTGTFRWTVNLTEHSVAGDLVQDARLHQMKSLSFHFVTRRAICSPDLRIEGNACCFPMEQVPSGMDRKTVSYVWSIIERFSISLARM